MIIFSERVAKMIWMDRRINRKVTTDIEEHDILKELIAILGLFIGVNALVKINRSLVDLLVILPEIHSKSVNLASISYLIYQCILLEFGILLLCFPQKLIKIKNNIKNILTRKNINYENVEEE